MHVSYVPKVKTLFAFVMSLLCGLQLASAATALSSGGSVSLNLTTYSSAHNFTQSSGSSPVWGYYSPGGYVEYAVNSASGGTYGIEISYATALPSAGMNVLVNGVYISSQGLPATGGWGSFATSGQKSVSLSAGDNLIRIGGWTNSDAFNIGAIRIISSSVVSSPAPAPAPAPAPSSPPPATSGGSSYAINAVDMPTKTTGGAQTIGGLAAWNVWSNGSVSASVPVSASGQYRITVKAYGQPAGGVWPNLSVAVDGAVQQNFSVSSSSWQDYSYVTNLSQGNRTIALGYNNDAMVGSEDRNLILYSLSIVPSSGPVTTSPANYPFAGQKLYVDPNSQAAQNVNACGAWYPSNPSLMQKISGQAAGVWFGGWNADVQADVANLVSRADAAGAMSILVAYNIPKRDCGSFSSGGSTVDAYPGWIQKMAQGIGNSKAAVILEPDALSQINQANCLSDADKADRYRLLKGAIATFRQYAPNTAVYLDAGNPSWIPAGTMASNLSNAGVASANGFALNVSNFFTTDSNTSYGNQISSMIGGKHFVIDTSRNGNGPTSDNQWCNPLGRALGQAPQGYSSGSLDATLWVKKPGESDGSCNGGPGAGSFWPQYACDLAARAK